MMLVPDTRRTIISRPFAHAPVNFSNPRVDIFEALFGRNVETYKDPVCACYTEKNTGHASKTEEPLAR